MARLLERYVEPPRACVYLPAETALTDTCVLLDVSPEEYGAMLARGWRRFGPVYFRPSCQGCRECVSIRVPLTRFTPSRSQRRAAKRAASLRRVVGSPAVDDARLALYSRWHAEREEARGWQKNMESDQSYGLSFAFPHPSVREAALYDGERLVGVGIWDEVPGAASAVYFYSDPDYASWSLGVANVVLYAEDARARGLEHVYLGYRVAGCASLAYKARFRPHELLEGRPSFDEAPVWREA
jgi:arginine-tRNA-protein transferase